MTEVHALLKEMNTERQLAIIPNGENSGMSHEVI